MKLTVEQQHSVKLHKNGKNVCTKCLKNSPDLQKPCSRQTFPWSPRLKKASK